MKLILKIPLNIPDDLAGSFLEAQQNVTDLFFRDLISAKQTALLETFAVHYPASAEQISALRETLKQEISLLQTALKARTVELLDHQDKDDNVQ